MANENGMSLLASLLKSAGPMNPAQSIINQMRMAGQPRFSQTSMTQPDESLDIGNIGILLLMLLQSGMFGGKKTSTTMLPTTLPSFNLPTTGAQPSFGIPSFSLK